ncbi:MAG: type II toxin-antitoxin system RelE/ParE family toxin [Nitrospira sp. CG24E]|nr:MAG: type II toxin-antitoxin system RelE/ParE family toxin [Nitrospira sp. CG24E]
MAGKRPRFTENFSDNLTAIEEFVAPHSRTAFHRFLDRLFDEVIPMLCQFPQSGRSFLACRVKSAKAKALTKILSKLLNKGDDLREFIMDDYLVLYLVRRHQVVFLAIKHHRQLSFDLKRFWLKE